LIVVTGEGHRSQTLGTGISAIHQYISRYFDSRQDIVNCQLLPERIQAEFPDHPQNGFGVAVGRSLLGGEQIVGSNQVLLAKQTAQGFDFVRRSVREVSQGPIHPSY
jgi:hypothetical protein